MWTWLVFLLYVLHCVHLNYCFNEREKKRNQNSLLWPQCRSTYLLKWWQHTFCKKDLFICSHRPEVFWKRELLLCVNNVYAIPCQLRCFLLFEALMEDWHCQMSGLLLIFLKSFWPYMIYKLICFTYLYTHYLQVIHINLTKYYQWPISYFLIYLFLSYLLVCIQSTHIHTHCTHLISINALIYVVILS